MTTRPSLIALTLALAGALPAAAQNDYQYDRDYGSGNALRFYGGVLQPEGDSQYWRDVEADFTGDTSDFEDFAGGIEYARDIRGNLRLHAGGSIFEGSSTQAYRGFEDGNGDDIFHDTTLTLATASLGLSISLAPRHAPVVPYVGVGAGLYAWELEEAGDFIDFGSQPLEIFSDVFKDDGVAAGWYWMAGLEVSASSSLSFFAQGRWHEAEDDLEGDFADLGKIDLSGRELTAGLSWKF